MENDNQQKANLENSEEFDFLDEILEELDKNLTVLEKQKETEEERRKRDLEKQRQIDEELEEIRQLLTL